MDIKSDNFMMKLANGKVTIGFYSPEDKSSVQLNIRLPDKQSEEAQVLLGRIGLLLDVVKLKVESVKNKLGERPRD